MHGASEARMDGNVSVLYRLLSDLVLCLQYCLSYNWHVYWFPNHRAHRGTCIVGRDQRYCVTYQQIKFYHPFTIAPISMLFLWQLFKTTFVSSSSRRDHSRYARPGGLLQRPLPDGSVHLWIYRRKFSYSL